MYQDLYMGKALSIATEKKSMRAMFDEFLKSKRRMASTERGYKLAFRTIVRGDYPPDANRIEADVRHFVTTTSVSKTSINTYLRCFKAFLTWLNDEHDIKVPRKLLPRYGHAVRTTVLDFTDDEVEALLSSRDDAEFTDMLLVMIETGARPVDVLTLQWDQVDMKRGIVTWLNKITKRAEPRPVSKAALEALLRLRAGTDSAKVFRWTHAALSPLTKRFRAHCASVGIDCDGRSLKHLRTTFKRRLMEKGLPFEVQMYLMRHSTPDVTLGNYTNIQAHSISL
jgi:integrase